MTMQPLGLGRTGGRLRSLFLTVRARQRENVVTGFMIKVTRVEIVDPGSERIRVTFLIERGELRFTIPVVLSMKEFDDTEIIQIARNELHSILSELSAQTEQWTLTEDDIRQLSSINLRPPPH